MKHKIIFLIAVLVVLLGVLSCGGRSEEPVHSQPAEVVDAPKPLTKIQSLVYSFEYDGCTYIKYTGYVIIHHEGCDNPKHICK